MNFYLTLFLLSFITIMGLFQTPALFAENESNLSKVPYSQQEIESKFYQGDFRTTLSFTDKVLHLEPLNIHALLYQGYSYTELGEFTNARNSYHKIFEKYPIHLTAFNAIGDTYRLENNFQESQMWYQKSIHENPFETYAFLKIADIQQKMGNYEDANTKYDKVIDFSSKDEDGRMINNGKLGKAISYYHLGDDVTASTELSYISKQSKDPTTAIIANIYEKIISLDNDGHNVTQEKTDDLLNHIENITLITERLEAYKAYYDLVKHSSGEIRLPIASTDHTEEHVEFVVSPTLDPEKLFDAYFVIENYTDDKCMANFFSDGEFLDDVAIESITPTQIVDTEKIITNIQVDCPQNKDSATLQFPLQPDNADNVLNVKIRGVLSNDSLDCDNSDMICHDIQNMNKSLIEYLIKLFENIIQ